jgi:hypothetical protein
MLKQIRRGGQIRRRKVDPYVSAVTRGKCMFNENLTGFRGKWRHKHSSTQVL